jgi:hypothetical protein
MMATTNEPAPDIPPELPPEAAPEERPEDVGPPAMDGTGQRYAVFDPDTGRILGTYGVLDAETGEYREQSEAEVRAMFEGAKPARVAAGAELGVLPLEVERVPLGSNHSRFLVDPRERRLVRRPRLRLATDRPEITGDGEDSAEIAVTVVDADGSTDERFAGEIRVSTTHGRLSVPGGRVSMTGGTATVTLTSTTETIDRVVLTARDPRGVAETGWLDVEFR